MLQAEVAKQMLLQEEQQLSDQQTTLALYGRTMHLPVQPSIEYSPEEVFAWGGAFEKIAAERHNLCGIMDQPRDKVLSSAATNAIGLIVLCSRQMHYSGSESLWRLRVPLL